MFYSALYRAMSMPTLWSDTDGRYRGFDGQVHEAKGWNYYTDLSLWDTFRTAHPLFALLWPEFARDVMRSIAAMTAQKGCLPQWIQGNCPVPCTRGRAAHCPKREGSRPRSGGIRCRLLARSAGAPAGRRGRPKDPSLVAAGDAPKNLHRRWRIHVRADLADQWTRWVYDQSCTTAPDGLVGNDDAGTLSAWAVLAGIGLYPRPGAPGWDLVAPRFDRVTLQLGGKSVVIEAPGVHAGQPRQAAATWQGQPLTAPPPQGGQLGRWLPHALVTQGGVLRFLAK